MTRNVAAALAAVALVTTARASVLTYSGYLQDGTGRPVTAATTLAFRFYTSAGGGTPVWEDVVTVLPTADGWFSAVLGASSLNPLDPAGFTQPLWLALQASTDTQEMSPRTQIGTVPYALSVDWSGVTGKPAMLCAPATGTQAGTVTLTGDLGGTSGSPTVTWTHLSAPLPEYQGGTGASSLAAATLVATGTTTARALGDRLAEKVNVRDYGAIGNGATDDSAAFVAALTAAAGRTVNLPAGTYVINSVTITGAADVSLDDGAVLYHKSASTDHMIKFLGTRLRIRGGTVNGNRIGQVPNRRYAIYAATPAGTSVEIEGVRFTATAAAALYGANFGGTLEIEHCRFADMAEHDGVPGHWTAAIYVESGQAGSRGRVRFNHNSLVGTISPANVGGAPGGIFFAPATDSPGGVGNFSTFEAMGNHFYAIGQNCAGNDVSPIHLYPATDGARIIGNYFEQCGFSAISAKSVQNFVCVGNVVLNGQTTAQNIATEGAIGYEPGYHSGTATRPRAVIANNVVDSPGGQPSAKQDGITVLGSSLPISYATDVIVANNVVNGAGVGIRLDKFVNATVRGNRITGSTGGAANSEHGIRFDHAYGGTVRIADNDISVSNGYGIYAEYGVDTERVLVDGNYIQQASLASWALLLHGMASVKLSGNTIDSSSGAVNIAADGFGHNVGLLYWDLSNQVIAGTWGINFGQVTRAAGHLAGPNNPESSVVALPGAMHTRTTAGDSPVHYVKRAGSGNTGWRSMEPRVSADRGDASVTLLTGADAEIQRFMSALTADRAVTLATNNTPASGDHFRIVRTGLGAFKLDIGPGLKVIPASTAAFVDVAYDGAAWVLTGYGNL